MAKKRALTKVDTALAPAPPDALLVELRELIHDGRHQTAQTVNAVLTLTNWRVGERIRREILKEKRAEYGAQIVQPLSAK
jgi:DUF1016 N-terminal domain